MSTLEWLQQTTQTLEIAGIESARLDCLVLLEDATGRDRAWLLSHPEHQLQGSEFNCLSTKVTQRVRHVPLAYIRGHADFYGREFAVNEHTLVPRPETEAMIELLCDAIQHQQWAVEETELVDVGTGSGAIAISTKLAFPEISVFAIDIDDSCLAVARRNAEAHAADVTFLQGDLLAALTAARSSFVNTILLCNLPYVPNDYPINIAAAHEPKLALFGGSDGLDLYRRMFRQIQDTSWKPRRILTESLPNQHSALTDLAQAAGYQLDSTEDFIQSFTVYATNR